MEDVSSFILPMPELPEVEVTRLGIAAALSGRRVAAVELRAPALRYPLPPDLGQNLRGRTLAGIARRGKYLLFDFGAGHVLLHLGMSGTLRVLPRGTPAGRHDHVDIDFGDRLLRLNDPRRFGALLWLEGEPQTHPLLADLGMEPLERGFTATALAARLAGRAAAIKLAIMDGRIVVGVGNIYASESLFRAGIDPRRPAGKVSQARLSRLVPAIKETLRAAIRAGGSSLRDFYGCDGQPGHFQHEHLVYGREGEPCRNCGAAIRMIRQGQRATYYCPKCQR
jgi:formamidopyrimidine-DNA glycosylase